MNSQSEHDLEVMKLATMMGFALTLDGCIGNIDLASMREDLGDDEIINKIYQMKQYTEALVNFIAERIETKLEE